MPDHIHMCLRVPPKYSVAYTIGLLKSRSGVRIHRDLSQARRVSGVHLWGTRYCVSTVG